MYAEGMDSSDPKPADVKSGKDGEPCVFCANCGKEMELQKYGHFSCRCGAVNFVPKVVVAGSCYECPLFRDCCAPSCGLDPGLDWSAAGRLDEEVHPSCPLGKQPVLVRRRDP